MATSGAIYDYKLQCWTYDEIVQNCEHITHEFEPLIRSSNPEWLGTCAFCEAPANAHVTCRCYGREHEGERIRVHLGGSCVVRDGIHTVNDCLVPAPNA